MTMKKIEEEKSKTLKRHYRNGYQAGWMNGSRRGYQLGCEYTALEKIANKEPVSIDLGDGAKFSYYLEREMLTYAEAKKVMEHLFSIVDPESIKKA